MDQRHLFVDDRLLGEGCIFCGGISDTRDHVPSKVFLDDPLPEDLPTVEACTDCNQSFSLDEEYLACFLEVVLHGSADPLLLSREKIKRALAHNEKLVDKLKASLRIDENGRKIWLPETDRVHNVILKLARGHAAYELSLIQLDEPTSVSFQPFLKMSAEKIADFESAGTGEVRGWPEIGTRAFLRAAGASPYSKASGSWVVVQQARYRYFVDQTDSILIRIVLGEYLACQVEWD